MYTVKVIVVGAGYWGKNYIKELSHNLIGVVETNEKRAKYIREVYGVNVYPEVPENLDFDGVVVCTPPETHVEVSLPFAKEGKFVLIEKPLGVNSEEIIKLYPYRNKIMNGLIYLFNPGVIELKSKLDGCNHLFFRRTNSGPVRIWQDSMWDLAPHDVSISNFLLGSPIGLSSSFNHDFSIIVLEYMGGVKSVIYTSWLGGPKTRRIEVVYDNSPERFIFDDVSSQYEISPLRLMLNSFLSGSWDKGTYEQGFEVVRLLEEAHA